MPSLRAQLPRRLRALWAARPLGWAAATLAAALPGAILLCILHCTLPSRAHLAHDHELFLCDHGPVAGGELPPPLSATLVLGLVQGLARAAAPPAAGLIFLHLAVAHPRGLRTRLGEAPPAPPPRLAA